MSWYKTGTIAATNGSKIITGTGTQFTNSLNGVSAGRMLLLPAAGTVQIYEIESVQSDTQLTLVSAFTGTTGTGKAYAIPTSPTVSIEQFSHEFASTLAYYQQQLSGWQQILTGTGNVTLTTPDGQTVSVRSQQAWDAALNGKADLTQTFRKRGLLGTVDLNTITGEQDGMWTQNSNANATLAKNYPTTIAGSLLVVQGTANGNTAAHQLYFPFNTTRVYIRYFLAGGTWGAWAEVWNSLSLVKQTGPFDGTAGSVMLNGAWGWGGLGLNTSYTETDFLTYARDATKPSMILRSNALGHAYLSQYSAAQIFKVADTWASICIGYGGSGAGGNDIIMAGGNNSGTNTRRHVLWTDQNLVKQGTTTDDTLGRMMGVGAFGIGASAVQIPDAENAITYLYGKPSGFYRASGAVAGIPVAGIGWGFVVTRFDTTRSAVIAVQLSGGTGVAGNIYNGHYNGSAASFVGWNAQWSAANLTKQSQNLATGGQVLVAGFAGGIGSNTSQVLPDATLASDFRVNGIWYARQAQQSDVPNSGYLQNLFGNPASTYGAQVWIDVRNSAPSFRYRTIENNAVAAWHELATLDTAQTVTAIKTHTAPVVTANAVAFRGTLTDGVVRNIGHVNAQNIVHLGDGAAPTTIHGFAMPLIQIGTGPSYAIVDTGTSQTITGAKVFTTRPVINASQYPSISLEATGLDPATVGSRMEFLNYNGASIRFYVRQIAAPSTGERYITLPTNATGTILVAGSNAVADANGFWKTASPVVKLFADGTSELTSEAEGITTERLSEGVYRISGCLGLNADRAWGGDDGGIDVPMCRNKLPRLWVDYGGDEGRSQINPDGSIVIRTYHRPHPDAPVFARNEIEGYANGDPIDIPHDTFISVRVQMPEAEVQEAVVETVPNAVESDVVSETATQE